MPPHQHDMSSLLSSLFPLPSSSLYSAFAPSVAPPSALPPRHLHLNIPHTVVCATPVDRYALLPPSRLLLAPARTCALYSTCACSWSPTRALSTACAPSMRISALSDPWSLASNALKLTRMTLIRALAHARVAIGVYTSATWLP
ncbi:hypothetical protein EVG20_g11626 [Dentipellis fragilis]|uniref:Uncharacterized protein n=1 Tax=Dentipellis fragilis TaxID=205917 RepID=A0A4Y9XJY2_9AGAM|nr:hypothetical protein EVG20_g11626 [Dentipellis fragilis]